VIKNVQLWQGSSKLRSDALCDAILKKDVTDCSSQEAVAQLVNEGMISAKEGKLNANFPTITSKENYLIYEELKPIVNKIVDCMDGICSSAASLFKKHSPKELVERCEQLAYVRYQADAMGIIVENLVSDGFLSVPKERTNLCVYGVRKNSDK
jgi:hypothetical protein